MLAVYTAVVYQVRKLRFPVEAKEKFSGVVSQIGKISAIYFPESYWLGACVIRAHDA